MNALKSILKDIKANIDLGGCLKIACLVLFVISVIRCANNEDARIRQEFSTTCLAEGGTLARVSNPQRSLVCIPANSR